MKTFLTMILIAMASSVCAQDMVLTKKDVVDISAPEAATTACDQNMLACLNISEAACKTHIDTSIRGKCSKDVPDTIADMEKVPEHVKQLTACAVKSLLAKHNSSFVRNINSPACQALQQ
ncbi:MAG TPA: hypothetical protein DCO77_03625 [Nitrospiraceae bacterium]|nr:hypothetical protein [Nitrospiraceae bacterium]